MTVRSSRFWLWTLLGAALALRLFGIMWGLPHAFNADEPHLVNLAVSFGGGSLRPYAFKYPTLWPYLLFLSYGLYFLGWSVLGLRHGLFDFVGYFGWHPTPFYLIGRLLSCAASVGAVAVVARWEKRELEQKIPWAALVLAFSPAAVEAARSLKPDSLLLLFCAAGWSFALAMIDAPAGAEARRLRWACGFSFGLALSSQFTALPAVLALPCAHFLCRQKARLGWLFEGLAAWLVGFLVGTPYALLDFGRFWFWASMHSPAAVAELGSWSRAAVTREVALNLWQIAGPGALAGLAAVVGLARLIKENPRKAVVLAAPIAGYVLALGSAPDGGWPRYLFGCFPAVALLAAAGLGLCEKARRPLLAVLVGVLAVGPGVVRAAMEGARMRLPDTRQQAQAWINEHIPPGAAILMDQPHAGPDLRMTREELLELAAKAKDAGSPRWRLFEGMARSHPGGGYRIYRITRTARDLGTYHPKQVELSQADAPMVDARPGLDFVRAVPVHYVLTSSYGVALERAPELATFFSELESQAPLAAVFTPVPGELTGPALRLYRLKAP